jgi:hypothetical protein
MTSPIVIIFLTVFSLSSAQAHDNCAEINGSDNTTWLITFEGTKSAIKSHCDLNQNKICENASRLPPMPAISCAIHSDQAMALRKMIDNHAGVNAKDGNGLTPLMHAAWASGGSYTRTLIAQGADLYAKDNLKRTAVYYAHLLQNTSAEAEIIKENFDKKNPCDFSYENLTNYYFVAQAETSGTYSPSPPNINDSSQLGNGPREVGTAILAGFAHSQSKKSWKPFIEKVEPYTKEEYYKINCTYAKNKSGSSGDTKSKAYK